MQSFVPLVCEYRGDLLDLTHMGYVCVVDEHSNVVLHLGDPQAKVFYRSASKPIQALPTIARRLDVAENTGGIDRRVLLLDGMTPVIRVPRARFWTKVKLLNGSSDGETSGGYKPIASESKGINFIYGNKAAMQGVLKRSVSKIVTPDQNQSADAYDIFYRVHHDLIVRDSDTAALYVHTMATAHTA